MYVTYRIPSDMGWLHLVGSLQWQVSFAKEPYERDDILQKRPVIWRSLLIVATPYLNYKSHVLYLRIPQLHYHLRPMYRCSGGSRTAPWAHVQECMWHEAIWHVDRNVCDMRRMYRNVRHMTCRRHMSSTCHMYVTWAHVQECMWHEDIWHVDRNVCDMTCRRHMTCSHSWHVICLHVTYIPYDMSGLSSVTPTTPP